MKDISEKILDVLTDHFGELREDERFWTNIFTVLDDKKYLVADKNTEIEKLNNMEECLRKLWESYSTLHPSLQGELGNRFGNNARSRMREGDGRPAAILSSSGHKHIIPLAAMLGDLHHSTLGEDVSIRSDNRPNLSNIIKETKSYLKEFQQKTHQSNYHETWQKVSLIDHARYLWGVYRGTDPADIPSEGTPFHIFVSELISACEKNWETDPCFKAWAKAHTDR